MTAAADLEDSVDTHPLTPGAVLPARELLGDMLIEPGHYKELIAAQDHVEEYSLASITSY